MVVSVNVSGEIIVKRTNTKAGYSDIRRENGGFGYLCVNRNLLLIVAIIFTGRYRVNC